MSGIAEQPGGADKQDIGQFVSLLLDALRHSGQSQAALAAIMYYSKSLLTKVIKGDSTPDASFFRSFFERGIPFLIAYGGVINADEVRAMASAAGVRLLDAELRVAALAAQNPEFLSEARRQGSPDDAFTAADARLAQEYAKARADVFEQSIEAPVAPVEPEVPTQPPPDRHEANTRRWVDTVDLLSGRLCGHTPAVFGRQMHIVETEGRLVWLAAEREYLPSHLVLQKLDGRSAILAGQPGSGRTSLLRRFGYQLMGLWEPGRPQAVYLRGPDILKRAGRRRTVVELLAEQVVAAGGAEPRQIKEVTAALDDLDRDRQLVWLIDDVDRLTAKEQADLAAHFVVSQAIYVVTPWQANEARQQVSGEMPVVMVGVPELQPDEQSRILDRFFLEWSEKLPDSADRQAKLKSVPALAQLPIGLAALYVQMEEGLDTPYRVIEAAAREFFTRAGLAFPSDKIGWADLPPTARGLATLGSRILADMAWHGPEIEEHLEPQERVNANDYEPARSDWSALPATRHCMHLEIHGKPIARFFNDDLLCYWASRYDTRPMEISRTRLDQRTRYLVNRVNRFRDECANGPPLGTVWLPPTD
jgi:hypothetical protein